jgi:hypothetical protein
VSWAATQTDEHGAESTSARRMVNWVQLESVMRHTSLYTTLRAASTVDQRGARRRRLAGPQDDEPVPNRGMARSVGGGAESKRGRVVSERVSPVGARFHWMRARFHWMRAKGCDGHSAVKRLTTEDMNLFAPSFCGSG